MHIHCEGKWEGVGPWNLRVFWALLNGIEPITKLIRKSRDNCKVHNMRLRCIKKGLKPTLYSPPSTPPPLLLESLKSCLNEPQVGVESGGNIRHCLFILYIMYSTVYINCQPTSGLPSLVRKTNTKNPKISNKYF